MSKDVVKIVTGLRDIPGTENKKVIFATGQSKCAQSEKLKRGDVVQLERFDTGETFGGNDENGEWDDEFYEVGRNLPDPYFRFITKLGDGNLEIFEEKLKPIAEAATKDAVDSLMAMFEDEGSKVVGATGGN